MFYSIIKQFFIFFLLIFLQICFFEKIHIFRYATPFPYIYFIIQLSRNINRNFVLFFSALIGLCIDIFNSILGLNMLACVIVGCFRFYFLQLFFQRKIIKHYPLLLMSFRKFNFFYYSILIIFLHQFVLFIVESLVLSNYSLSFILQLGKNIIITIFFIFIFDRLSIV